MKTGSSLSTLITGGSCVPHTKVTFLVILMADGSMGNAG